MPAQSLRYYYPFTAQAILTIHYPKYRPFRQNYLLSTIASYVYLSQSLSKIVLRITIIFYYMVEYNITCH